MESSRRKMLKKTAIFAVPTIMTFNLMDVQACVSGAPSKGGNHYGDDKRGDMNDGDNSQWNGGDNPHAGGGGQGGGNGGGNQGGGHGGGR
jgi:hypothetical protein